jgi:uncharacterized membrane protein
MHAPTRLGPRQHVVERPDVNDIDTTSTAAASCIGPALRPGLYLGIGAIGAVDEIVFHQLVQWHHFYVHTDRHGQIVSDGLLHLFTLAMLLLGAVLLWDRRRLIATIPGHRPFVAGILLGMGGFQLFDGTVNHKLLDLHEIRYGVDLLPYDLVWNGAAVLVLALGVVLARRSRRDERSPQRP